MKLTLARYALIGAAAFVFHAAAAFADTISYTGNLRTDANVTSCGMGCTLGSGDSDGDYAQYAAVVESFAVSSTSTVQAITFGYGGGVNGNGTTIVQGGFEPYLSLFDSSGNFLSSTYFGTTCPVGANTNTLSGECYDVSLDAGPLSAGTYEIAISAYMNMSYAENSGSGLLSDGFTGLGNLYSGEDLDYAFDVIINGGGSIPPPPPSVPEPPPLVLVGLASVLSLAYRRCHSFFRAP